MEILKTTRESNVESLERRQLRELEASGLYVFHGSETDFEELEPRQAIDTVIGNDEEPSVHASQLADYAIFMAVAAPLGRTTAGSTSNGTNDSFRMKFSMQSSVQQRLTDQVSGLVYVLDKKDFVQRRPAEWISKKAVKPLFKVRVSKRDLPKDIEIFQS